VFEKTNSHIFRSVDKTRKALIEERLWNEKRKQRGISFPSPTTQEYILIVRLNVKPNVRGKTELVRQGLKNLCAFFDKLDKGDIKIDVRLEDGEIVPSKLSEFNLSTTIGFGSSFFDKSGISDKNRPRKLYEMPGHADLGDPSQYVYTQSDLIVQICSTTDFVNRWVFKTDSYPFTSSQEKILYSKNVKKNMGMDGHDIVTSVEEWASVTDVHSGFQRLDGRNLMGFMDGVSQPQRLNNNVIWTTRDDEADKLIDGTYMVFQKIEHDLELWEKLSVTEQERWIGRSKGTGLLLGTLSSEEDEKLAEDCKSNDPKIGNAARTRLKKLLEDQKDPSKSLYSTSDPRYKNIPLECPIWSHVRKANPRGANGEGKRIIFRRGYLFMEDTIVPGRKPSSGLLFICFQRDIRNGFEYIKKRYLTNKNYPVPELRKNYTREELLHRHRHGRFTQNELKEIRPIERSFLGLPSGAYAKELEMTKNPDTQNTGREGLAGPSQLGVYPRGEVIVTISQGGGYYFVPPIPDRNISEIGQQFFG
jgi:Dyp-type peroxidase family